MIAFDLRTSQSHLSSAPCPWLHRHQAKNIRQRISTAAMIRILGAIKIINEGFRDPDLGSGWRLIRRDLDKIS